MSLRVLSAALAVGIGLVGIVVASPAAAVDPATPVHMAIAVPITVPASAGGLIAADALAEYTSPAGTLTRQLDAVISRPVALGVDPRIIVSIRILGTEAPASATAWLQRLSTVSNETFSLSYADSDLTLATQAGSPGVLQPETFDFAIDPTRFAEAAATTPPSLLPPTAIGFPLNSGKSRCSTDAKKAAWFQIDKLPKLAFDHKKILKTAIERLQGKITYEPIGFELLDKKFPFSDLEKLYTTLLRREIDRRNFKKKITSLKVLDELDEKVSIGPGRPASLFSFNRKRYFQLKKEGIIFEI